MFCRISHSPCQKYCWFLWKHRRKPSEPPLLCFKVRGIIYCSRCFSFALSWKRWSPLIHSQTLQYEEWWWHWTMWLGLCPSFCNYQWNAGKNCPSLLLHATLLWRTKFTCKLAQKPQWWFLCCDCRVGNSNFSRFWYSILRGFDKFSWEVLVKDFCLWDFSWPQNRSWVLWVEYWGGQCQARRKCPNKSRKGAWRCFGSYNTKSFYLPLRYSTF